MSDRQELSPLGLFGGAEGSRGSLKIQRGGTGPWKDFCEDSGKRSASKFSNAALKKGDRVTLVAPSGGGYGNAREREPELVQADLRAGWTTYAGVALASERDQ